MSDCATKLEMKLEDLKNVLVSLTKYNIVKGIFQVHKGKEAFIIFRESELRQIQAKISEDGCMKKEDLIAYIEALVTQSDWDRGAE